MSESEWHWCWLPGRTRVQRRGLPTSCPSCMRWRGKHRCGLVPEYKDAQKDYPVTECAGCTRIGKRSLSEGPREGGYPERAVEDRDPSEGKPHTGKPVRTTRRQREAARARRKQLLVLAVSHGVRTQDELRQVCESFGVHINRRLLYDDLTELLKDRWLMREQEQRDDAKTYQQSWRWVYSINPKVLEKFNGEGT